MNATKPRYEAGQENLYCRWCRAEYDPSETHCKRYVQRARRRVHQWEPVRLDAFIARVANEGDLNAYPNAFGGLDLWATSLRLIADDGTLELLCFDGAIDRGVLEWRIRFDGLVPVPVILATITALVSR